MNQSAEEFLDVVVELPLEGTYCYKLPPSLRERVRPGCAVWVPFGKRAILGVVMNLRLCPPEDHEPKEILQLVQDETPFSEEDLQWYRWVSQYYAYPLGAVLKSALSSGFRGRPKRQVRLTELGREAFQTRPESLPPEMIAVAKNGKIRSFDDLTRRLGAAKAMSALARCQAEGWVEVSFVSNRIIGSTGCRRTARLTSMGRELIEEGHPVSHRLGERQRQLLQLLANGEERTVASLERIVPGARGSLLGLGKRGLVEHHFREVSPRPLEAGEAEIITPPPLSAHQAKAMDTIEEALIPGRFQGFLLWGITGSGKTEVYLQASDHCVRQGRQVIALVPEISLTDQLVQAFRGRFGERIGIIHSRLSAGERAEMWRAILDSEVSIVLGARSALFAPCRKLGLIIVDEEHDAAYKQDRGFRYHARDLALMRGKINGAVVLVGSATPSLETFYNAQQGKLESIMLPERVEGRSLPTVEIVDLRGARARRETRRILSSRLVEAIYETLERGEQTLLFLNRRGYATSLMCPACGHVFQCANCAVTLVYHLSAKELRCHYCGWACPAPALCPGCGEMEVMDLGVGTETLHEEVQERFPDARILRMDRDTTTRKNAYREILGVWKRGEADILIGTQMVAKGHHVPRVTLVGVVLADTSLNFPDFRASERTFQLLLQVAGRAGRGDRPGRVIIQTFHPDHPSIRSSASQDYLSFARHELVSRQEAGYPPYRHLVLFRMAGPREDQTASFAGRVGRLAQMICRGQEGITCLGPSPAPLARIKGRYRWHLLLKGASRKVLNRTTHHLLSMVRTHLSQSRIRLSVDVDPLSFM